MKRTTLDSRGARKKQRVAQSREILWNLQGPRYLLQTRTGCGPSRERFIRGEPIAHSMQCFKVCGYVAGLLLGKTENGHGGVRFDRGGRLDPLHEIFGIVRGHAGNVSRTREEVERRSKAAMRVLYSGDLVAGSTAILSDDGPASLCISSRRGGLERYGFSSVASPGENCCEGQKEAEPPGVDAHGICQR